MKKAQHNQRVEHSVPATLEADLRRAIAAARNDHTAILDLLGEMAELESNDVQYIMRPAYNSAG